MNVNNKILIDEIFSSLSRKISDEVVNGVSENQRHEFLTRFYSKKNSRWHILTTDTWGDESLQEIYSDQPLALAVDKNGQIISAQSKPSFLLALTDALSVRSGERVLEVGYGSGWLSAIFCYLVGGSGRVVGVEIDKDICLESTRCGMKYPKVFVGVLGDVVSVTEVDFDVIVSTSSGCAIPNVGRLLKDGGRMSLSLSIPGGGDRTILFKRIGDRCIPYSAEYSLSVPGRGEISSDHDKIVKLSGSMRFVRYAAGTLDSEIFSGKKSMINFIKLREYIAAIDDQFRVFHISLVSGSSVNVTFGFVDETTNSASVLSRDCIYYYGGCIVAERLRLRIDRFCDDFRRGIEVCPEIKILCGREPEEYSVSMEWFFREKLPGFI